MAKKIKSIGDLTPDPDNANRGTERGMALLEESLSDCGAGRSVLADKNGVLIAGNKTTEVAGQVGIDEVEVVQTQGDELVVVQRTDLDLSKDKAAKKLAIVDNRVGQVNLDWDYSVLERAKANVDLDAVGFTADELALGTAEGGRPEGMSTASEYADGTVKVVVGEIKLSVPGEEFDQWFQQLSLDCEGSEEGMIAELKRRLGMESDE